MTRVLMKTVIQKCNFIHCFLALKGVQSMAHRSLNMKENKDKVKKEEDENEDSDSDHFHSALRCPQCKIVRETREKFINHLKSRRHRIVIEIHEKS